LTFENVSYPSISFVSFNGELLADGSVLKGFEQIGNFDTRIYAYAEVDVTPSSSDSILKTICIPLSAIHRLDT